MGTTKFHNKKISPQEKMTTTLKKEACCSHMQKIGRFAFTFLFFFIVAIFATAFHHHEDGNEHHDCPVCAAWHYHSSASVSIFSITNQQSVLSNEIPKVSLLYNSVQVALLPCRAPPA
jgi:hypothetical protein